MKKKRMKEGGIGLWVLLLTISTGWCVRYKHVGCWMDVSTDPDFTELVSTPETVTLAECASKCTDVGLSYVGLKGGKTCGCSNKYGRHGTSPHCNYTCEDGATRCGGVDPNDVYYAVDSDITTRARRDFYVFTEPKTFDEARKDCIKGNGDLVVIRDPSYINRLQSIANSSGIGNDLFWIGLFWNRNNRYTWTDASIAGLSAAEDSVYWRDGEAFNHECVLMSVSGKDWITGSCAGQYPYICHQLPPKVEEVTQDPDATEFQEEEESKGFFEDNTKLTYYFVLPMFIICYGGSCLVYAIGKCWKYCKRRKRQQARDAMLAQSTEFEPDTKPLTQSDSRPLTSRDVKMEEGYTPPPPYYRVNSRASKLSKHDDRPVQTPVKQLRPDEEEEIKPRPQSRVESRRSALLENAYSQAKERRIREGQTPEPQQRPRSSRTGRYPDLGPPAIPPPPMQSPKPPRRADQYKVASPPPEQQEPDIDYTKLSISDIMYIRGLMSNAEADKKKRKKPKKIIVA